MGTAIIETSVTGKPTIIGSSREDLQIGNVVLLNSVDVGSSYSWSIIYKPDTSTVNFSSSPISKSPGTITLDKEGTYLIRLIFTDGTGITEQFIGLTVLTQYGSLRLVAGGETLGPPAIPSDISPTGWADTQNYNLLKLLQLIQDNRPTVQIEKYSFDFNSTSPVLITELQPNESVVKIFINCETTFNSLSPSLSIGDDVDVNRFVSLNDVDLSTLNKYEFLTIDTVSISTNIKYYPNFGGSTQGSGTILVLIQKSL